MTVQNPAEGAFEFFCDVLLVLNSRELMRVDVQRDARTSVSHLPRHRDDVCSLSDEVRPECVTQIVERQPRQSLGVEAHRVRRLGQTPLREVAIAERRSLTRREHEILLSRKSTTERRSAVLAKKFRKLGQEDNVAAGAAGLQLRESRWVRLRAARQLVPNPNDTLVEIQAPPA